MHTRRFEGLKSRHCQNAIAQSMELLNQRIYLEFQHHVDIIDNSVIGCGNKSIAAPELLQTSVLNQLH